MHYLPILPELRKHLLLASRKAFRVDAQGQECIHPQHPSTLKWLSCLFPHLYPVMQTMPILEQ